SSSSRASKKSKASSKKSERPTFDAPAPAGVDISDEDDSSSDELEEDDEHAFDHPSTYVDQPWIWMPKDRLGLSQLLVNDLHAVGVDASDVGAFIDEKGVVEVTRNPPDEEWIGGRDS
ncbi:phosphate metabolism protein-domain-containing protein, partial [Mycena epipterygia]